MINEANYNYLVNLFEDTGLGSQFNSQLRAEMEKGLPEITLSGLKNFRKDLAKVSPILKKGTPEDPNSNYFLNKYQFQIVNCAPDSPKAKPQTIYVDARPEFRPNNLTPYQVSRLMDRASIRRDIVSKNGAVHRTWYKTNFQVVNDYGNFERFSISDEKFSVENQLNKPNIVEARDPKALFEIANKLAAGESAKITLEDGDKVWNLYISANIPMGFNAYDLNQKRFLKEVELDVLLPPLYPRKEKVAMDVKDQADAPSLGKENFGNKQSVGQPANPAINSEGIGPGAKTPDLKQTDRVDSDHSKAAQKNEKSEQKVPKKGNTNTPASRNRKTRGKSQGV